MSADCETVIIEKDIKKVKALFTKLNGAVLEIGILKKDKNPLSQIAHLNELGGTRTFSEEERAKKFFQVIRKEQNGKLSATEADRQMKAIQEIPSEIQIPSRSFLRSAFDDGEKELLSLTARVYDGVLTGKMSLHAAIQKLGNRGLKLIKGKIESGAHKANAPITKDLKGDHSPLMSERKTLLNGVKFRYQLK